MLCDRLVSCVLMNLNNYLTQFIKSSAATILSTNKPTLSHEKLPQFIYLGKLGDKHYY